MLDLAQAVREQIVKETPPRKGEKAAVFKGLAPPGALGRHRRGCALHRGDCQPQRRWRAAIGAGVAEWPAAAARA